MLKWLGKFVEYLLNFVNFPHAMKNWQVLGKFYPELEQKFVVFIKTFLNVSLSILMKFSFISFHLGLKYLGSHEFCSYLVLTVRSDATIWRVTIELSIIHLEVSIMLLEVSFALLEVSIMMYIVQMSLENISRNFNLPSKHVYSTGQRMSILDEIFHASLIWLSLSENWLGWGLNKLISL